MTGTKWLVQGKLAGAGFEAQSRTEVNISGQQLYLPHDIRSNYCLLIRNVVYLLVPNGLGMGGRRGEWTVVSVCDESQSFSRTVSSI